jgi:hypothetical protein
MRATDNLILHPIPHALSAPQKPTQRHNSKSSVQNKPTCQIDSPPKLQKVTTCYATTFQIAVSSRPAQTASTNARQTLPKRPICARRRKTNPPSSGICHAMFEDRGYLIERVNEYHDRKEV